MKEQRRRPSWWEEQRQTSVTFDCENSSSVGHGLNEWISGWWRVYGCYHCFRDDRYACSYWTRMLFPILRLPSGHCHLLNDDEQCDWCCCCCYYYGHCHCSDEFCHADTSRSTNHHVWMFSLHSSVSNEMQGNAHSNSGIDYCNVWVDEKWKMVEEKRRNSLLMVLIVVASGCIVHRGVSTRVESLTIVAVVLMCRALVVWNGSKIAVSFTGVFDRRLTLHRVCVIVSMSRSLLSLIVMLLIFLCAPFDVRRLLIRFHRVILSRFREIASRSIQWIVGFLVWMILPRGVGRVLLFQRWRREGWLNGFYYRCLVDEHLLLHQRGDHFIIHRCLRLIGRLVRFPMSAVLLLTHPTTGRRHRRTARRVVAGILCLGLLTLYTTTSITSVGAQCRVSSILKIYMRITLMGLDVRFIVSRVVLIAFVVELVPLWIMPCTSMSRRFIEVGSCCRIRSNTHQRRNRSCVEDRRVCRWIALLRFVRRRLLWCRFRRFHQSIGWEWTPRKLVFVRRWLCVRGWIWRREKDRGKQLAKEGGDNLRDWDVDELTFGRASTTRNKNGNDQEVQSWWTDSWVDDLACASSSLAVCFAGSIVHLLRSISSWTASLNTSVDDVVAVGRSHTTGNHCRTSHSKGPIVLDYCSSGNPLDSLSCLMDWIVSRTRSVARAVVWLSSLSALVDRCRAAKESCADCEFDCSRRVQMFRCSPRVHQIWIERRAWCLSEEKQRRNRLMQG